MVAIRPLLPAILMFALLAPASASAAGTTTRIIVKQEPGLTAAEQQDIRADVDATLVEKMSIPRTEVIEVERDRLSETLRSLRRDPDVAVAEPDRVVHSFSDDPDFGKLWGLENTGQLIGPISAYRGFNDVDIDISAAWGMSRGTGRTVAVVDSGVLASHADFLDADSISRAAGGLDWVDEDAGPNDADGHGTHVTGTIAAGADNQTGIAGVAPESRILPLRVLDANGEGHVSDIIEAFHFAGQQGVRVVNASLGGTAFVSLEKQEIDEHPNTLFVVAAGNQGQNNDGPNAQYPCAFTSANVLCVGAHHAQDSRASFSNYGAISVDVYAPGYDIYSTSNTGGYEYMTGTSMAAPHVAGLAALLLARDPALTTPELKEAIMSTVIEKPVTYVSVSGGRVNAAAALASVPADRDGDHVLDDTDNCPDVPNEDQRDTNTDEPGGDACAAGAAALDIDGDGVVGADDLCPEEPNRESRDGCPGVAADSNGDGLPNMFDGDSDGVRDTVDNCPTRANHDQADTDGDGVGDACDSTPRGPVVAPPPAPQPTAPAAPLDSDHDGRPNSADACPTEPASSANGCPLPYVTTLAAKGRKRAATITVRTSRAATVRITVQRKRGHKWVRVSRKTLTSRGNRARITLKKLRKGSYRAVVVVSSTAGTAAPAAKRFRVR
jgi:thermitase